MISNNILMICSYRYDLQGRMIAVESTTTISNNVKQQKVIEYNYKSTSSQFPEKCILPSGNEFKFLRDDSNEELFGIVTPKQHTHLFKLIPLMGKTLFHYRPPWIKNDEETPFYVVFNDIIAELMEETLLLPNGDSVMSSDNSVIGCQNSTSSNSVDKCHKIKHNVTDKISEIISTYEIEGNKEVISAYSRKILLIANLNSILVIKLTGFYVPFKILGHGQSISKFLYGGIWRYHY